MLSERLEKELNSQINKEFYASYLYLSMAAYAEDIGLEGIAHWFRLQSEEEYEHAMKIYEFVNEKGGRVVLEAIDKPQTEYKSVKQLFELALEHEEYVTDSINKLVDLAIAEKDHSAVVFLQWFVEEQVEEEDSVNSILDKFKFMREDGMGILMLNKDLGSRE
ncbi:MAG: ferritin [Candidatus Cloacimonas sp.]|jgi:ferritin|nr:ferritin [Candidatus Cloacimonadota bacterium]